MEMKSLNGFLRKNIFGVVIQTFIATTSRLRTEECVNSNNKLSAVRLMRKFIARNKQSEVINPDLR